MLQKIRDGASGPLAYVVVGVIAVVFGVWGIGSYFTPSSNPVVASVGKTDITHGQLQNAFNQRYQQLRQMMGDSFNPDLLPPAQIRQNVLQTMINEAVLDEYATDQGYRVTDSNLLAEIQNNPAFQNNGQFSPERYRALLGQAGMSPPQYEAALRQSLKSQDVQALVGSSAFVAPAEVGQAYALAHQQRNLSYLLIDPRAYAKQAKIDDSQIKTYYDAHPKQFIRPERVKLAYVSLDQDDVKTPAPDAKALKSLYEQRKASLGSPAQRSADEIRVAIGNGGDAAARQAIQAASQAVAAGKSFKAAADSVKGATYTTLDKQPQNALDDALGQALFALNKGQVSTPVHTDKAWYLLKLTAITPANTPAFDDPAMQAQLKTIASQQAAADAYRKQSDKLETLAYQAPNDLQTLSKQLSLPIQHSDWLDSQTGPGIGQYDAVRKAAFSDSVLKDKLNSQVIDLGQNRKMVLRVADRQPAQRKPLAEVADSIRQRLTLQAASEKATDAARKTLASAKQGQSLAALAKDVPGASLKTPGYVDRSDNDVDPRILDAVFGMPTPAASKSTYDSTPTSSGGIAVVALQGVRDGAANDKQAAQARKQVQQQQLRYVAGLEYNALSDYLRSKADVTIDKNNLN